MLPYQTQYVQNTREIAALRDFYAVDASAFDSWYAQQRAAAARMEQLRRENIALLSEHFFPRLDDLYNASPEEIAALEEFGDELMDWKVNLDCGVYILIHDSLLSLYRSRRDRDGVIRELYKLGMGLYYQDRMVQGIEAEHIRPFRFRNEMVFTEAGSYLKFFEEFENEETKGYVIRALANIAICTSDKKRRIAITSRILRIVRDDYYRALAPGLPWDSFLRKSLQQMCSNRSVMSTGGLSKEELAALLDACHEVYKPEQATDNPNVRWLWPYYEMEYTCGFVDLQTTMDRMEALIDRTPCDQYDVSGLYANVQLPIYYGKLVKENPHMKDREARMRYLVGAYRKMIRALMRYPLEKFDDAFRYDIILVLTEYYDYAPESEESYRAVTKRLTQRLFSRFYIRSRRASRLIVCLARALFRDDPAFFDDVGFLRALTDPAEKEKAVLEYADACGLYYDFGRLKMGLDHLQNVRELFEIESRMMRLHTVSGHDDLARNKSTEIFADVALGHHAWYNGAGGYPTSYVRTASPYRQMTDVVAVAAYMLERFSGDAEALFDEIAAQARSRFSPIVASYLSDKGLRGELAAILGGSDEGDYREMYELLTAAPET